MLTHILSYFQHNQLPGYAYIFQFKYSDFATTVINNFLITINFNSKLLLYVISNVQWMQPNLLTIHTPSNINRTDYAWVCAVVSSEILLHFIQNQLLTYYQQQSTICPASWTLNTKRHMEVRERKKDTQVRKKNL